MHPIFKLNRVCSEKENSFCKHFFFAKFRFNLLWEKNFTKKDKIQLKLLRFPHKYFLEMQNIRKSILRKISLRFCIIFFIHFREKCEICEIRTKFSHFRETFCSLQTLARMRRQKFMKSYSIYTADYLSFALQCNIKK